MPMAARKAFTETEQKMLDVLADGEPHTYKELQGCLYDEQGTYRNVARHMSRIRKRLKKKGETIVCVWHKRKHCYQHVAFKRKS